MATGKQQVKRALQPHLYFLIYAQLHACLEGNNDVYGDIAAYVFWLSEPIFPNYPSSFHVGSFFPHNDLWRGTDGDPDELVLQQ